MGAPFSGAGEPVSPNAVHDSSDTEEINMAGEDDGQSETIGMGKNADMEAAEQAPAAFQAACHGRAMAKGLAAIAMPPGSRLWGMH